MGKILLSVDDLSDAEIERILGSAAALETGDLRPDPVPHRILGLFFKEASLRTRVGFAAAASRLGWHTVDITDRRFSPVSMVESWADTLRTLSGYLDGLVCRPGVELDEATLRTNLDIAYVNAGGAGPGAEHPSQALIDVRSIEAEAGDVRSLTVAVCGDLRMRAVRSLFKLLARPRWTPEQVVLVTLPELSDLSEIPQAIAEKCEHRTIGELGDVDIVYIAGIPHGAISETGRDRLRLTPKALDAMPPDTVVLSPMPVIDEIDDAARMDPRVRMFQQSRRGLFVRQALLMELVD